MKSLRYAIQPAIAVTAGLTLALTATPPASAATWTLLGLGEG